MNTEENMTEQEETNKMSHEPHRPHEPHAPMRLLLLLLPLLLACSEGSETPSSQESQEPQDATPIAFSGSLGAAEAVTRATPQPLEAKTHTFTVYGYKNTTYDDATHSFDGLQTVMPAFIVNWVENTAHTTTTNTHDWEYVGQGADQTIKYWDWGATAYRFFATAETHAYDSGSETTETHAAHTPRWTPSPAAPAVPTTMTLSYHADVSSAGAITATPYFSRLWFSTGNPADYPTRPFGRAVQLEFVKPMVQVRFLFTYEDPTQEASTTLTDKSFRPTESSRKMAQSGTVTIGYPLSGTATTETVVTTSDTQHDLATLDTDNLWYDLLPATAQGTFTLSVNVNGEPQSCTVPAEYMEWKAGFQYTYKFKLHAAGGVSIDAVQSAFTPWDTTAEANHAVYNW